MQLAIKMMVLSYRKRLSEYICNLLLCGYMKSLKETFLQLFPHQMAVNINVLGSLMKDLICNNLNGSLVAIAKLNRNMQKDLEVFQNIGNPQQFTNCGSHSTIFCLNKDLETMDYFLIF